MHASKEVVDVAGGAYEASLNHYGTGGNCFVTTVQVDQWVYVVGQDDFSVARYTVDQWLGHADEESEPQVIECDDAVQAWELLRLVREGALLWQCRSCGAWVYTSNRPRIGLLPCSTCADGGVAFG